VILWVLAVCNLLNGRQHFGVIYCLHSLPGVRGSVVGCGTMLQAGRSRDRIPMRSLDFAVDLNLPAALWPLGRLSL
jgi:hypothetical protein